MFAMGSPPVLLLFSIRFDPRRHTADEADTAAVRWTDDLRRPPLFHSILKYAPSVAGMEWVKPCIRQRDCM